MDNKCIWFYLRLDKMQYKSLAEFRLMRSVRKYVDFFDENRAI